MWPRSRQKWDSQLQSGLSGSHSSSTSQAYTSVAVSAWNSTEVQVEGIQYQHFTTNGRVSLQTAETQTVRRLQRRSDVLCYAALTKACLGPS